MGRPGTVLTLLVGLRHSRIAGTYTAVMSSDVPPDEQAPEKEAAPALPEHLSALVGSLHGPADLGRNHEMYLTYTVREVAGGAGSA